MNYQQQVAYNVTVSEPNQFIISEQMSEHKEDKEDRKNTEDNETLKQDLFQLQNRQTNDKQIEYDLSSPIEYQKDSKSKDKKINHVHGSELFAQGITQRQKKLFLDEDIKSQSENSNSKDYTDEIIQYKSEQAYIINNKQNQTIKGVKLADETSFDFQQTLISRSSMSKSESQRNQNNQALFVENIPIKKTLSDHEQQISREQQIMTKSKSLESFEFEQQQSSKCVIEQAHRQRILDTLDEFTKFVTKYQIIVKCHRNLMDNIATTIEQKRVMKILPSFIIKQFLNQYGNIGKQFHEKSYKYKMTIPKQNIINNQGNPVINMKAHLSQGCEELNNVRIALGNNFQKMAEMNHNFLIKQVYKIFAIYDSKNIENYNTYKKIRDQIRKKQKMYEGLKTNIQLLYSKQTMDIKDDLFIEMIRFIKASRELNLILNQLGITLTKFKKQFIKNECNVFQDLQGIIKQFAKYSSNNFINVESFQKNLVINYFSEINQKNQYIKLCKQQDVYYIQKMVQFINDDLKTNNINERQIQNILEFDSININQALGNNPVNLLKGAIMKSFLLRNGNQIIVTISGTIVEVNMETLVWKNRFSKDKVKIGVIQRGVIELHEIKQGILFDKTLYAQIQFKSSDHAEQFLMFLGCQV